MHLKGAFAFVMLLIFGLNSNLVSQSPTYYLNPDKKLSQYNFERWSTENGLPSNSLLHIHQAKDGYLWVSGYSGLIRFNGSDFQVFNNRNTSVLQSNVIRNISEDSSGKIWLTTQGNGLISIKDNQFKAYGVDEDIYSVYRGLLVDKSDRVWAASPEVGWFYLEDEKINVIEYSSSLKNIEVRAIAQSYSGAIWFATLGEGLFKYENGILTSYKVSDGLINDWVYTLYVDDKDNLWIGTSDGVCYFDGKKFHKTLPEINTTVNKIIKDRFGDLWVGTIDGLYRKKFFSNELEFINASNGLPNDFVIDFLFDTEGNMWLTHYKGGLGRIKDGKFTNYTIHSGFPAKVVNTVVEIDEDNILVGFDSGELIQIKNGVVSPYQLKTDLSGIRIRHLLYSQKGNLFVSTYSGLLVVEPNGTETWYNENNGLIGTKLRVCHIDKKKNLWVGTRNNGLIKVNAKKEIQQYTVQDGLSSNLIMAIDEDNDGNIWVGTSEGLTGLSKIDADGKVESFSKEQGFSSNVVFNITVDKNNCVWFASVDGLWIYRENKFHKISTRNGLFDNSVFDVAEDNMGFCWLPYADGIMKIKRSELERCIIDPDAKVECRVYNKYDGLPTSECNPTAQIIKDKSGKLYFSTLEGLSIIDPQNVMINNFIPPVVIEELKVDNHSTNLSDDLVFNSNDVRYTFNFTALSFYEPEMVHFEYMLEGFDKEWNASTERSVSYTNLKHGEYKFVVRACNNDGVWNTTGDSVEFLIKPKFTESTLFYIIILIGVLVVVYLIFLWRFSVMRKNQTVLEHTIAERTKEIRTANETLQQQKDEIANQNKVLQTQKTEIEDQTKELEKQKEVLKESILSKDKIFSIISHDLRSPLGNIRNMLSLLIEKSGQFDSEKKDRILGNLSEITKSTFFLLDNLLSWSRSERGLVNYDPQMFLVAPIIAEILSLTKPHAQKKNITVLSKIEESTLAFGDVNMVETILRNFIENALKFTNAGGTVEVFYEIRNDFIEFGVKDDGIGMDDKTIYTLIHKKDITTTFGTSKEKGSGLGLLICKEFIRRNGGEFRIESEPGKGSTFFFTLKRFQI